MNAGSYVIIPNSSAATLIWRRSVALIVPSWIGTSYFLPVRLSVIVSVSGMRSVVRLRLGVHRLSRHSVTARNPPPQIRHLAALAAERTPGRIDRLLPAVDAQRVGGGAQTPQLYLEIWKCGNLEIYVRFPVFQIS